MGKDLRKLLKTLQQTIKFSIEEIPPKKAAEFLATMGKNRPLSRHDTRSYTDAMASDDWTFTGECIIFNDRGEMIDGQHRCHAIIKSGVSIIAPIIRGVPGDTILNLNTGRRRTGGNVLAMKGHAYGTAKTATVRSLFDIKGIEDGTLSLLSFGRRRISTQKIVDFCDQNGPLLDEAVTMFRRAWRRPALFSALFLRLSEIDPDRSRQFFQTLLSGHPVAGGKVILDLRDKLDRTAPHQRRTAMACASSYVPLVYRAWNAWVSGTKGPFDSLFNLRDRSWPTLIDPKKSRRAS